jgi:hypothetical protein
VSRSRLSLAAVVLALIVLGGCGNDPKQAAKPRPRTTTTRTATAPARTETSPPAPAPVRTTPAPTPAPKAHDPANAKEAPGEGNGKSTATPQGGSDGPQNDTPPPSGSPAERFEKDCDANPQSCG